MQYQFVVWGFGWDSNDTPCTTVDFQCMDPNTGYGYWFDEYSNIFTSGQFEQGGTGYYLSYVNFMNPQICPTPSSCNGAASSAIFSQNAAGNNVFLNQNVVIDGYGVVNLPEPATCALAGMGLIVFACLSRKLRK